MQDLGDVIVCCLIQLLVGHVRLNKYLASVSHLGRLLAVHGYSFIEHLDQGFYYTCHFM
jgi:hypothetical protein